jgi:hypothetical protein
MIEYLKSLDISIVTVVAGGVGSFLSALKAKFITFKDTLISFLVGFGCAIYLAPLMITYFNLPDTVKMLGGVSFIVGFMGFQVSTAFTDLKWSELVGRFIPGGPKNDK